MSNPRNTGVSLSGTEGSPRPPVVTRRSFIERLGMGAGAALLSPIARALVAEAQGAAASGTRKRAVFFVLGDCFLPHSLAPAEFADLKVPVMDGPTSYTLPTALQPLAPVRNRLLLIDGLANLLPKSQHSGGYGALSCVSAINGGSNEASAPPGAITIDQFVANRIGASTRLKSVLVAQNKYNVSRQVFASGPGNAEAGHVDPQKMFREVLGGLGPVGGDGAGTSKESFKNQLLLSTMRADITRLQKALAGAEKAKLDNYLALINDHDQRQRSVAPIDCKAATPPPASLTTKSSNELKLDSLFDMGTLALACGVTNVLGVSAGCGQAHLFNTWPLIGHAGTPALPTANMTIAGMFSRIMRLVGALQQVKEGDRTAFDNSLILFTSDNGGSNSIHHHTDKIRWPVVVIGNAGGALKADGRFVRTPARGKPGNRSLADFYCTVGHALGAPTDTFGMGGPEPVRGPMTELLA